MYDTESTVKYETPFQTKPFSTDHLQQLAFKLELISDYESILQNFLEETKQIQVGDQICCGINMYDLK